MTTSSRTFTVFLGKHIVQRGTIREAAGSARAHAAQQPVERIAVYDDLSGEALDLDLRGTEEEVLARLEDHPLLKTEPEEPKQRGPGRPKLGVVSREVSLLPRHWRWLGIQKGGASAALRRLVESAQKLDPEGDRRRMAQEAAHRFMWDMAGDMTGFEEASRAFYGGDFVSFYEIISAWPNDVKEHTRRLVERYRSLASKQN